MRQFQLVPYDRLQGFFSDQCDIPFSQKSLISFNSQTYKMLEPFEAAVKELLRKKPVLQADETGINIGGKLQWLHGVGSQKLPSLSPAKIVAKKPSRRWEFDQRLLEFCVAAIGRHTYD